MSGVPGGVGDCEPVFADCPLLCAPGWCACLEALEAPEAPGDTEGLEDPESGADDVWADARRVVRRRKRGCVDVIKDLSRYVERGQR